MMTETILHWMKLSIATLSATGEPGTVHDEKEYVAFYGA
jgi:hypothetical protein